MNNNKLSFSEQPGELPHWTNPNSSMFLSSMFLTQAGRAERDFQSYRLPSAVLLEDKCAPGNANSGF